MSLSRPRNDTMVCWNCDGPLDRALVVELRASSGEHVEYPLCAPCYRSVYLPLASDTPELRVSRVGGESILVVEDDASMRRLLELVLISEGYHVSTARNGVEALEEVRRHTPDAIVLDLRLPVMSGQDFLKAWRQQAPEPLAPVIAISAHHQAATAEELGVASFLRKPFELKTLIGTVAALVEAAAPGHGTLSGDRLA